MAELELTRPNDKLAIKFRGEDRLLFMSFQRLNSCLRVLGEPDNLTLFMLDPDASEGMIKVMLSEKPGVGEMFTLEIGEEDLGYEDTEALLLWVREHLTHFFLKRFLALESEDQKLAPLKEHLKSSALGSASLSSPEPVAGPSTAAPPT